MTGFGRGEASSDTRMFIVEIRSVNHRYCDIAIKMPRQFLSLEERIRRIAAQKINRGKVDVFINYEEFGDREHSVSTDTSLARAYIEAANSLKSQFSLRDDISLSTLLRIPDVIRIDSAEPDEGETWDLLNEALSKAIDALVSMRSKEGEKLADDITKKIAALSSYIQSVEERAPHVISEYREKLCSRLNELLGQNMPDENRIAAEIVIFADKSGIDEEIMRLKSHIGQAEKCCASVEPIGRKLDFILQEINREINTIGSKSSDVYINEIVVEMKTEAEKIREQIQNLE